MAYPQSPDLSSLAPRSPVPEIPELYPPQLSNFGHLNSQRPQHFQQQPPYQQQQHTNGYASQPTSLPQQHYPHQSSPAMPPRAVKSEDNDDDDDYIPDARAKRARRVKQEPSDGMNGMMPVAATAPPASTEDPTLGCQLNTSFPVARIKRIMQADEDIGKVAQVTPTVVSRALELFMIKLISSSAFQARGAAAAAAKGPKRVLSQHLKRAVLADEKFDFLNEIVQRVPDAPAKSKKETGSDSEDAKPKKRGKKRKDSGDDF